MLLLAPGIPPLTNIKFFSAITLTTSKFNTVVFTAPMCPGMFLFLNVLDGSEEAPIEPTALWNLEPCDIGPLLAFHLLITPWNPLPLDTPETSILSPAANKSALIS